MLFPSTADIDWNSWLGLAGEFRDLPDSLVGGRYHFGQLRLSRLNWAVRLFRPPSATTWWFYDIPESRSIYSQLWSVTFPVLYVFASLSLVLSSMQVVLSTNSEELGWGYVGDVTVRRAFWSFTVLILCLTAALWALTFTVPAGVLVWQMVWGFRHRNGA